MEARNTLLAFSTDLSLWNKTITPNINDRNNPGLLKPPNAFLRMMEASSKMSDTTKGRRITTRRGAKFGEKTHQIKKCVDKAKREKILRDIRSFFPTKPVQKDKENSDGNFSPDEDDMKPKWARNLDFPLMPLSINFSSS